MISQIAASVSRLAETEWGRACEHVRKFAPFVGGIGECRVLCEGGWNGDLPADLPDETLDKATLSNDESTKTKQEVGPDLFYGSPPTSIPSEPTFDTISPPQNTARSRSNTLQVIDSPPKREISQSPKRTLLSASGCKDSNKRPSPASTPVNTISSDPPVTQRSPSPLDHRSGPITEEPEQSEQFVCPVLLIPLSKCFPSYPFSQNSNRRENPVRNLAPSILVLKVKSQMHLL